MDILSILEKCVELFQNRALNVEVICDISVLYERLLFNMVKDTLFQYTMLQILNSKSIRAL